MVPGEQHGSISVGQNGPMETICAPPLHAGSSVVVLALADLELYHTQPLLWLDWDNLDGMQHKWHVVSVPTSLSRCHME